MPAIDFNCYANAGIIKIPENYQDWYDKPITVILLRQESTLSAVEATKASVAKRSPRPIGLAKDKFQVSPLFFDELPEDLLDAFEGNK
ncbi:MAG TPA: hypothetical protein ENG03_05525 [Thioploca sp.]|nr:MAG: hypothetical protein DRR19_26645 [Gammaproteobacteria bacterium]HDN26545.1 hypothetical protein [Thioploca sp.]